MHATLTGPAPQIVREYTTSRAFYKDAQRLYTRTGYTVMNTTGLARRSYYTRALILFRLRPEHLVITYGAPTNPWPMKADAQ